MARVEVRPIRTSKERRQFLELPWKIYQGDPNWVPPLRGQQAELVGYRPHPFWIRNRIETFLAYRDGQPCGRIAAIVNYAHNEYHQENRGFWGFFESIDDLEVASRLFDAARQWLEAQGMQGMRGPMNPALNYTLGTLVEGFGRPPYFMMTYNPPYYPRLIESYGFRKAQDLYAYEGWIDQLPEVSARFGPTAHMIMDRLGITLRPLDRRNFLRDVEAFIEVYNKSLQGTWGFVPMSKEEVRHTAKGLRYLLVPELALGAEINGRLVGAVLCLPDYNPRIKAIDGRLFPFGFLRLILRKDQIKRVRILAANVLPEYHRMGIGLVLLHGLVPKALEWGITEAEFSWVLESNTLSRGSLEKGGAVRTKTYRIYDLQ
jgi:GNAT superfamily N-acetyltransferase